MFPCLAVLVYNEAILAQSARVKVASAADQRQKSSVAVSGSVSACPCWNPLALSLKPEDCCYRTDAGSLSGQAAQCAAHATINGTKQTPEDDCSAYCFVSCFKIPHADDKETMIKYLGSKAAEIKDMGPADLLLARAVWQAQTLTSGTKDENIDVKGIHALHPVGGWRADTWKKTLDRKAGVLAATEQILAAGGKLTKKDTNSTEALRPMRSVTNFLAVPFAFNGITHVLLEGNGRLKGMQLAAEEDPAHLRDLKVQVDLLTFTPQSLITVQEGILELWNQYIEEAFAMKRDNETQLKMLREYASFGIAVVKCMGAYEGWISSRSECKVVNSAGDVIRTLPVGTPIGVRGKRLMPNGGTRYKLYPAPALVRGSTVKIEEDEYLLEGRDSGDQVAWEYCRKSIRNYP